MPKLSKLVKAVLGLPTTTKTLDGRPLPESVRGCKPVAVVHDRRLSAGIFEIPVKGKKSSGIYRIVTWRTYRHSATSKQWRSLPSGRSYMRKQVSHAERATTTLHADEIEPMLDLVNKLGDRFAQPTRPEWKPIGLFGHPDFD